MTHGSFPFVELGPWVISLHKIMTKSSLSSPIPTLILRQMVYIRCKLDEKRNIYLYVDLQICTYLNVTNLCKKREKTEEYKVWTVLLYTCTVNSRYLAFGYLDFCEVRSIYLNQNTFLLLSQTIIWRWGLLFTRSANYCTSGNLNL